MDYNDYIVYVKTWSLFLNEKKSFDVKVINYFDRSKVPCTWLWWCCKWTSQPLLSSQWKFKGTLLLRNRWNHWCLLWQFGERWSKKIQLLLSNSKVLFLWTWNVFSVPLSDPTCYAPVIDYVRTLAESMDDGRNYVVLLIITDGGISGKIIELKMRKLR